MSASAVLEKSTLKSVSSALKEKARDLGVSISRIKHLECNQIPALALIESSQGVEPQFDVRNLANIE